MKIKTIIFIGIFSLGSILTTSISFGLLIGLTFLGVTSKRFQKFLRKSKKERQERWKEEDKWKRESEIRLRIEKENRQRELEDERVKNLVLKHPLGF